VCSPLNGDEFEVKFLKLFNAAKSQYTFICPIFTDSDVVDYDDIVKVLPEPKIGKRGHYIFETNFTGFILG
jgi:hypothetical protein